MFSFSCFETDDDIDLTPDCNVDSYISAYEAASNAFTANMTYANCVNLKSKASALLTAIGNCESYNDDGELIDSLNAINGIDCSTLP